MRILCIEGCACCPYLWFREANIYQEEDINQCTLEEMTIDDPYQIPDNCPLVDLGELDDIMQRIKGS